MRLKIACSLGALLAAGCAVGPDFKAPDAPNAARYTAEPIPGVTAAVPEGAGQAQRLLDGQTVSARWWNAFGSDALNELVEAALRSNPDLQAADAALRTARENALAQRGSYWPSADAHLVSTRQAIADPVASPAASGSSLYTLHTAQLNVSYVADVFGGNRRQVESLDALAEAQRFQREAAYLTLTTNVVATAVQEASLRAQIKATHDIIDSATRLLEMARKQRSLGQITAADVAAQETALAQTRAALAPLDKQLAQQRDLLAVLAGRLPSDAVSQRFELDAIKLPEELPLSLPSQLVEQRPDIRAALAQLHSAGANIGVAKAARLPSLTLSASGGSSALALSQLLKAGGGFWSIGADLAQPVFNGGTLLHRQRAAEAAYEQAAAQYRSTVLTAFQNVADTLYAIDADARALSATSEAERAAQHSLVIARRQWELGAVGYPTVLNAQQAYAQSAIALVQAKAARYADTIALFQALGGGWWNRPQGDADTAP